MPGTDFDFSPRDSDLRIGLEVEYPERDPDQDDKFADRGRSSNSTQSRINRMPTGLGNPVYDGTVGLEVVSDVLNLEDAPQWYADVIGHIESEHNAFFQPTGLMRRGSTAGLHIHLSRLSDDEAQRLYEISQTPWAKVLFCTSIARDRSNDSVEWPVFRGGSYCRMEYDNNRYCAVNSRGGGHYEWRLPEPMAPEHLEIVVKFLALFGEDVELAIEYAQEVLDDADDRLTSVKRAEAVGMDLSEQPTVERQPYPDEPETFYETVEDSWGLPEIHRVDFNGDAFYLLDSDFEGEFTVNDVTASYNSVLYADTLESAGSEVAEDVRRAFSRGTTDGQRETPATDELKKIIKKKKGNS